MRHFKWIFTSQFNFNLYRHIHFFNKFLKLMKKKKNKTELEKKIKQSEVKKNTLT